MSKFNSIIVTSEVDNNYFVINSGTFNITYLVTLTSKNNIDVANMIMPAITKDEIKKNKIFIRKDSVIGYELSNLIKALKLVDECDMIREEYVLNALVMAVMEDEQGYLDIASKLIREKTFDTIEVLKKRYDEDALRKINMVGRKFDYTSKCELTGFEENGVTYRDNVWYYFDIKTKKLRKMDEEKRKVRN